MATAYEVGDPLPASGGREFPSDSRFASAVRECLHPRRAFRIILCLDQPNVRAAIFRATTRHTINKAKQNTFEFMRGEM